MVFFCLQGYDKIVRNWVNSKKRLKVMSQKMNL